MLLPEDVDLDRAGFARLPFSSHPMVGGREHRGRLGEGVPRVVRLICGLDGLGMRFGDGDAVVRWQDVVGVTVLPDRTHVVQSADGPTVAITPGDFRGGDEVLAAVLERTATVTTSSRSSLLLDGGAGPGS